MIAFEDYVLTVDLGSEGLSDLALHVKRPDSSAFEEIELEEENIKDVGNGFYDFHLLKEDVRETGTYIFQVLGYQLEEFVEREALPKPLSSSPSPEVCIVTGNVRNISGQASIDQNTHVTVRPLELPVVSHENLLLGNKHSTVTDFDGFFSLPVVRNSTVIFEIKDAGVRFRTEIPDVDTIRIEELIP